MLPGYRPGRYRRAGRARNDLEVEPIVGTRRTVTVYTRRGCHLCEDAIALVTRVVAGRADIELVDIDGDVDLCERYTVRVPVVAVDGVEIADYQVSADQLDAALR